MNNQKGNILVVIIVMMAVTAILGAGFLVINGTSFMTAAKSSNFNNALYLAEAGIRYGQSASVFKGAPPVTLTMADTQQQIIVQKDVNKMVTSTGVVYPGTALEARMTLTWSGSGGNPTVNPTDTRDPTGGNPNNIIAVNPSTFTGGDLTVFNLLSPDIRDRLTIQAFYTGAGAHVYWAALKDFLIHATVDGESPPSSPCNISYLFIPISQTYVGQLRNVYNCNGYVSYQMATKVGWINTLSYAAQGLNFRWSESSASPGLYEGYGLSFMIFDSRTVCSSDYIPNNIKPGPGNSLAGRLLLVLWKQKVDGGVETRKWLAYAELGRPGLAGNVCTPPGCVRTPADHDPMVTGGQDSYDGRVNDDATIGVRVEDVIQGGTHHNEIKVFYGDASPYFDATARRTPDAYATNTNRQRYFPQWVNSTYFSTWPSHNFENLSSTDNTLTYWSYCGWLASTAYIRNPNAFDTGEIAIPTMRYASDGQDHNYIVTQADSCTCAPAPATCPANCTCPAACSPMNCSISGTTEPTWPVSGTVTDGTSSPTVLTWQEHGTGRPTARYDWFTVLNTTPQGPPNNLVTWVINTAATEIDLDSDKSTIKTYEFVLDSFPAGRQEIGLHGMASADFVPLAFDDLSISILGRKE